jgi:hypothetical protein
MAVRFDATDERLYRTANLPSLAGPWTICLWAYHVAATAYGGIVAAFSNAATPANDTPSCAVAFDSAGTRLSIWHNNAVSGLGSTPGVGVWFPVAVTRGAAANRTDLYYNRGTTPDVTMTTTLSGTQGSGLGLGGISSELNNLRVAAVKWWSAVLTPGEMVDESQSFLPWRTANLEGCYPMVDVTVALCAVDYSGLGRTLTSQGTLAVEDGPPIPWRKGRRQVATVAAIGGGPPAGSGSTGGTGMQRPVAQGWT